MYIRHNISGLFVGPSYVHIAQGTPSWIFKWVEPETYGQIVYSYLWRIYIYIIYIYIFFFTFFFCLFVYILDLCPKYLSNNIKIRRRRKNEWDKMNPCTGKKIPWSMGILIQDKKKNTITLFFEQKYVFILAHIPLL